MPLFAPATEEHPQRNAHQAQADGGIEHGARSTGRRKLDAGGVLDGNLPGCLVLRLIRDLADIELGRLLPRRDSIVHHDLDRSHEGNIARGSLCLHQVIGAFCKVTEVQKPVFAGCPGLQRLRAFLRAFQDRRRFPGDRRSQALRQNRERLSRRTIPHLPCNSRLLLRPGSPCSSLGRACSLSYPLYCLNSYRTLLDVRPAKRAASFRFQSSGFQSARDA